MNDAAQDTSDASSSGAALDRLASYIKLQVDPQIQYFDRAAARAKRWHQSLYTLSLTATASIPVVNGLTESVKLSTVLAAIASVSTGLAALNNYKENWVRYRRTADALTALKSRAEAAMPPFADDGAPAAFVERAERIMSSEGSDWESSVRSVKQGSKPGRDPRKDKDDDA